MLDQRRYFQVRKRLLFVDRLALSQVQKTAERTVRFSIKRTIESMDRLAIIEGQKSLKERLECQVRKR